MFLSFSNSVLELGGLRKHFPILGPAAHHFLLPKRTKCLRRTNISRNTPETAAVSQLHFFHLPKEPNIMTFEHIKQERCLKLNLSHCAWFGKTFNNED